MAVSYRICSDNEIKQPVDLLMTSMTVPRGLDGVIVDETHICRPDKDTDRLYYRGYAIEDLARNASYEEVAYLVVNAFLTDPFWTAVVFAVALAGAPVYHLWFRR